MDMASYIVCIVLCSEGWLVLTKQQHQVSHCLGK
jgi:hypothetical protein